MASRLGKAISAFLVFAFMFLPSESFPQRPTGPGGSEEGKATSEPAEDEKPKWIKVKTEKEKKQKLKEQKPSQPTDTLPGPEIQGREKLR